MTVSAGMKIGMEKREGGSFSELVSQYRCLNLSKTDENDKLTMHTWAEDPST